MLNIDWFQPFKHSVYSVGALYIRIMNLPRSVRFKPENVILVGLIPGPHEPRLNINSYLQPLVAELNQLFTNGLSVSPLRENVIFHAALLCVACDIPAARKVCGFTGHASSHGCSKCQKVFSGTVGCMDYSGFEQSLARTNAEHRSQAQQCLDQTSATDKAAKEQEFGTRFSDLMMIPYFECVRFHIIDPMHNLFLGTAKHVMKHVWLTGEDPLINKNDLKKIQSKVDTVKAPSTIGTMPMKIENSYGGFTADQWKTWTLLFSIFALWDVLPSAHLEVWRDFVMACNLFCTTLTTETRAKMAHTNIARFCRGFEHIYGKQSVTPNMHMHTHILECILDYVPVYSFWLFSFERYNGILGDYKTNQRAIEMQLMQKFLDGQYGSAICLPTDMQEMFLSIVNRLTLRHSGTLSISFDVRPSKMQLLLHNSDN